VNTQINIHKVTEITVEQRVVCEPGDQGYPDGLVTTRVMFDSADGPILVVCFGVENAKPILVTTLKGGD
jgi:hypothetical protein